MGDTWSAYGDGLSPKQRKLLVEAEDRKQVLYLKKQDVSREISSFHLSLSSRRKIDG